MTRGVAPRRLRPPDRRSPRPNLGRRSLPGDRAGTTSTRPRSRPGVVSIPAAAASGTEASLLAPPEAVAGIGSEAFLVQPAPGLFEVWVSGAHGKFKLGAQSQATAIALATTAAGRD